MKFLEKLVVSGAESAANTWTTHELDTPNEPSANLVMHLRKLFGTSTPPDPTDADSTQKVRVYLLSKDHSAEPDVDDTSILASFSIERRSELNTEGMIDEKYMSPQYRLEFFGDDAIVFGKRKLYLGIVGVSNSGAMTGTWEIFYFLAKVSSAKLLDAITED